MDENWLVRETGFSRDTLPAQETVFTIGNGYLSTRGAFEEGYPGERGATLIHGVFDDAPVVMTELANTPDWLPFAPVIGGRRLRLDEGEVTGYERTLNLRNGLLRRTLRWRSPAGQTVDIEFERFTSMADKHVLAQRLRVTPVDFSGEIAIEAGLNGAVDNMGLEHWNKVGQGSAGESRVYLQSGARNTGIMLCEALRLLIVDAPTGAFSVEQRENAPTVVVRVRAEMGRAVTAEKIVTLYTSLDVGRRVREAALQKLDEITRDGPAFERLLAASEQAWARRWERSDVQIEGDDAAQIATRFNLYQLLIAGPEGDPYVSIAAKTLSGFGYRGHVFWDTEIFILPFFTFTQPETARDLLLYRYHNLGGARRKAADGGYAGAQFPWESSLGGEEATPKYVVGPDGGDVRVWTGDIELHISADIAYAIWQYWQASGDDGFMVGYGAEMILDTAQFWARRAEWDAAGGRYELNDVIGPDEYHEHVDNNFFTNYLVKWHLELALRIKDWLERRDPAKYAELAARLGLDAASDARWRDVIDKVYLGGAPDSELFEQFEGYFQRRDVDLAALEPRGKSVQALLGIEETNKTQVLKQPDVLMLMYLLPGEFSRETVRANWDYYAPRTDITHGSSLAPGIQAILACRMGDPEMAYPLYMQAAQVDLKDLRHNTLDGIHGATAGSVWQAAVLGFGGVRVSARGLDAEPRLPAHWRRLKFKLFYHGELREFDFENPPR
jgi:trehalose/maltose hydrolase-like predicted phosphorylase